VDARKVFSFSINVLIGYRSGRLPPGKKARERKSRGVTCNPPSRSPVSCKAQRMVPLRPWSSGGWVTSGTAREKAQKDVTTALASALSPICVVSAQRRCRLESDRIEEGQLLAAGFSHRKGWLDDDAGRRASKRCRCAGLRHDAHQSSKVISLTPPARLSMADKRQLVCADEPTDGHELPVSGSTIGENHGRRMHMRSCGTAFRCQIRVQFSGILALRRTQCYENYFSFCPSIFTFRTYVSALFERKSV
jgi:hypothetical protein